MPLTWTIHHPERLIHVTIQGDVAYDDVVAFIAEVSRIDGLPYAKLCDARLGTGQLSDAEFTSYAGMAAAYQSVSSLGPLALVIDPQADAASSLHKLAAVSRPFRVFYGVDEAKHWLAQEALA